MYTNDVTVGDFSGDGKLDLVTANFYGDVGLSVLLNTYATSTIGRNDFNGDSKSDILWRNIDGTVALWQMDGSNAIAANVLTTLDNSWKFAGSGDYNGDGKADILWRNNDSSTALWAMNGAAGFLGASADNNWQIV
jgi:hypothetical protein